MSDEERGNLPTFELPVVKIDSEAEAHSSSSSSPKGIGQWLSFTRSDSYKAISPGSASISEAELAKHSTTQDMWMALNQSGKRSVYDVTSFAEYHPGGQDILLQYAGTDASEAFRMAHAYVNVNMIENLRKGFLTRTRLGQAKTPGFLSPSNIVPKSMPLGRRKPSWDWQKLDNGRIELFVRYPRCSLTHGPFTANDQCRALAVWNSPPASTTNHHQSEQEFLLLRVLLNETYHRIQFCLNPGFTPLLKTLHFRPACDSGTVQSGKTGKLSELHLELAMQSDLDNAKPISSIGTVHVDSIISMTTEDEEAASGYSFMPYEVVENAHLEPSPYRFIRLRPSHPDQVNVIVPLGHHVLLRLQDTTSGIPVTRPYTPVCDRCWKESVSTEGNSSGTEQILCFLIKIYPDGQCSQLIGQLNKGDSIQVSLPMGQLKPDFLSQSEQRSWSSLFMLAAGSGITPMLRLIQSILPQTDTPQPVTVIRSVKFIHFNRSQNDRVWMPELTMLKTLLPLPDGFSLLHVLSESGQRHSSDDNNNRCIEGSISDGVCRFGLLEMDTKSQKMKEPYDEEHAHMEALWFICGPPGFNTAAFEIARTWKVPEDRVFIFRG